MLNVEMYLTDTFYLTQHTRELIQHKQGSTQGRTMQVAAMKLNSDLIEHKCQQAVHRVNKVYRSR